MDYPAATKKFFYFFTLIVAFILGVFNVVVNTSEAIGRAGGQMTVMSQMSWLSDRAVVAYCSLLVFFYLTLMTIMGRAMYTKKQKAAIIAAAIIFVSFLLQLYLEDVFIYNEKV
jgi:hypothetical protein